MCPAAARNCSKGVSSTAPIGAKSLAHNDIGGVPPELWNSPYELPRWTRPALPRRPKAFPHQLLRAQSALRISRGASIPTNRSLARYSCDLTRRPSAVADEPESLGDTGDLPHDPKEDRWLSVPVVKRRERASESCPQLRWFPVVDAVHRVRGSLTDAVPLRRNWIGPALLLPSRVAPPRMSATLHRSRMPAGGPGAVRSGISAER
jgi:hypothetical protein